MATPISKEQQKQLAEDHEKATLLKNSLKIVDKLAKIDINEVNAYDAGRQELQDLIDEAKKMVKHRLFVLR